VAGGVPVKRNMLVYRGSFVEELGVKTQSEPIHDSLYREALIPKPMIPATPSPFGEGALGSSFRRLRIRSTPALSEPTAKRSPGECLGRSDTRLSDFSQPHLEVVTETGNSSNTFLDSAIKGILYLGVACNCWIVACNCWIVACNCWIVACNCWIVACNCWIVECNCKSGPVFAFFELGTSGW
jgi:hypothetical protein